MKSIHFNKRCIIALTGISGSGKDAFAQQLVAYWEFVRLSLADRLKDSVADSLQLPKDIFHDVSFKDKPMREFPIETTDSLSSRLLEVLKGPLGVDQYWTPRALCILEGTLKRLMTVDYWSSKLVEDITHESADGIVVTDLRFKEELKAIMEVSRLTSRKVYIINITRPGLVNSHTAADNELAQEDFVQACSLGARLLEVKNSGELCDLKSQVNYIMYIGEAIAC